MQNHSWLPATRRLSILTGTRRALPIAAAPNLSNTAGADRPQTPPSRPPLRPPSPRPPSPRGFPPQPLRPPPPLSTARAPRSTKTSRSRPILCRPWSLLSTTPSSSDSTTPTRPRPPPLGTRPAHLSQRTSAMRLHPLTSSQCHEFKFQGESRRT